MSSSRSATRVRRLAVLCALLLTPLLAQAGTSVRFDLSSIDGSPFPNDHFTRADWQQNTLKRVNLPKPDCSRFVSDCADIDVLNSLDGFNVQPRITVPFDGDIDPSTVNSQSIFLIHLGDTLSKRGLGQKVGINQVLWDPASKTLVFESDQQLDQHSRYALIVTTAVRDSNGRAIQTSGFARLLEKHAVTARLKASPYLKELREVRRKLGLPQQKIAAISLFTTRSVTADLEKIHRRIQRSQPAPVDFRLDQNSAGGERGVFAVDSLLAIEFSRQTGSAPTFTPGYVPTTALAAVPGSVASVAFGRYQSPNYRNAERRIPVTPTLLGTPRQLGSHPVLLEVFLPSGPRPAGGWPVVIFGHGLTDSMYGSPWAVAASFASQGIATVAINAVGHGGGPLSTLRILRKEAPALTLSAGGRSFETDNNGQISIAEGLSAAAPYSLLSHADGVRQTTIDLMQLVRQIEAGIDVQGDGEIDLDARRIYYASQSFGGVYGIPLLALEPKIRAAVTNVAGGSMTETGRLGIARPSTGAYLALRQPSLINLTDASGIAFDENIPLRDEQPRINQVAGAMSIQRALDRSEWAQQSANAAAYAVHIRQRPLPGRSARPFIFQFAKGDQGTPNPTSTAIVRAGRLADRATFYRHDLAYARQPAVGADPHSFLTSLSSPALRPYALMAQQQMATFFASDGSNMLDPDGGAPFFEVPALQLPETLNFIR